MSLDPAKLPPPPPRKTSEKRKLVLRIGDLSAKVENIKSSPKEESEQPTDTASLEMWQNDLRQKEMELKQLAEQLSQRESYIERCENDLLERSLQLTEREAHLEQKECNLAGEIKRFTAA